MSLDPVHYANTSQFFNPICLNPQIHSLGQSMSQLSIDYLMKGNQLAQGLDDSIRLIPHHPAFVIGQCLKSSFDKMCAVSECLFRNISNCRTSADTVSNERKAFANAKNLTPEISSHENIPPVDRADQKDEPIELINFFKGKPPIHIFQQNNSCDALCTWFSETTLGNFLRSDAISSTVVLTAKIASFVMQTLVHYSLISSIERRQNCIPGDPIFKAIISLIGTQFIPIKIFYSEQIEKAMNSANRFAIERLVQESKKSTNEIKSRGLIATAQWDNTGVSLGHPTDLRMQPISKYFNFEAINPISLYDIENKAKEIGPLSLLWIRAHGTSQGIILTTPLKEMFIISDAIKKKILEKYPEFFHEVIAKLIEFLQEQLKKFEDMANQGESEQESVTKKSQDVWHRICENYLTDNATIILESCSTADESVENTIASQISQWCGKQIQIFAATEPTLGVALDEKSTPYFLKHPFPWLSHHITKCYQNGSECENPRSLLQPE